MLHIIGLGLNDENDITLKGLKIIQTCQHIFLEAYTSILNIDKTVLVFTRVEGFKFKPIYPCLDLCRKHYMVKRYKLPIVKW